MRPRKGEALMERLKARSMWEWDEDFPNDEDEIYYYVGQGPEVSNERRVTESSSAVPSSS